MRAAPQAGEDFSSIQDGWLSSLTEPPQEALKFSAGTELAAGRWKNIIQSLPKDSYLASPWLRIDLCALLSIMGGHQMSRTTTQSDTVLHPRPLLNDKQPLAKKDAFSSIQGSPPPTDDIL